MKGRLLVLVQLIVVAGAQTCGTRGGGYDYSTGCRDCGPSPCVSGTTCYSCAGSDGYCYPYLCQNSYGEGVCSTRPCSVSECSRGEYLSSGSCRDCSAGRYQSSYSHSDSSCDRCPSGQYQYSTGSSSCRDCPSGKTSTSGADSSADCYSTSSGSRRRSSGTSSDYDTSDTQASSLVVTDCSIKLWQAEWLDSMFSVPEKMTSDIYSTDPDIVSPDCQDSVGNAYDTYFPSWARSLVSAGLSSDIPNGDEVCHLICEQGCGARWMDPSGYFIAVEIDCGLPIYVKGKSNSSSTAQTTIVTSMQQQQQQPAAQPTVVVAQPVAPPPAMVPVPHYTVAQMEPASVIAPLPGIPAAQAAAPQAPQSVRELRELAAAVGAPADAIEDARDAADPVQALRDLIAATQQQHPVQGP